MLKVLVSDSIIDLASIMNEKFAATTHGACNSFIGIVREVNHGKKVVSVSYDAYVPLAIKTLTEIAKEAQTKWVSESNIFIQHRTGTLQVGEVSVAILVYTKHREESFQMCKYIIEELKVRVPIWKKETYIDGETEWLRGHALCSH
jgi:molybdopterin synthase catalytic subunit